MADNTTLSAAVGTGDIISTDVITTLNGGGIATGEKAQRVKVGWGVDATFNDTNASNPLPVVQTGTPALPTGAATSANQTTELASLATIATNTGAATPAGSAIIGKVGIDQTTPGTTNFVAANLTQINGSAISASNPLPTTQVAPTGNGFTPYKLINAATTNATNVKASAGDVGGIQVYNNSGVVAYFKLYDKASAPTVGSDTPVKTIIVPANTSGAGTNVSFASPGISFTNGISFALTTGITDADTGAIASANTISINIDYK